MDVSGPCAVGMWALLLWAQLWFDFIRFVIGGVQAESATVCLCSSSQRLEAPH